MSEQCFTCGSCSGTGFWIAPAVKETRGVLRAKRLVCLDCGGDGHIVRSVAAGDIAERMATVRRWRKSVRAAESPAPVEKPAKTDALLSALKKHQRGGAR